MLSRIIVTSSITALALCARVSSSAAQDYRAQAAHSPDSALRQVALFLADDTTVQAAPPPTRQFLLIENRGDELRIVARASSKADLHVLGRGAGAVAITGLFLPGVVAPSKVEFYVFRPADRS